MLDELPLARLDPVANHPLAHVLRRGLPDELRAALGAEAAGLAFRGSAGRSAWAAVPWAGVLDPAVTTDPTRGAYVVLLFAAGGERACLSLVQGTVAVRRRHGAGARAVLAADAAAGRARLAAFAPRLPVTAIDLAAGASASPLPGDYEAAHVMGAAYARGALPGEARLRADLRAALAALRALTRGPPWGSGGA